MAEGTYEYECMRAELLGISKPDYDEFMRNKQEAAEEEQVVENLKDVDLKEEGLKHVSGGLDELNSILHVTQKKIHRFKASCSSLKGLFKFKLGSGSNTPSEADSQSDSEGPAVPASPPSNDTACDKAPMKSDLAKALDTHCDKLDVMLQKAENAQYSMSEQTKEMRRFLK